ncbi:uncharacterized protein LOC144555524 isoform X2 [Carex rostrata]
MQESRESLVSLPCSSTLVQSPICTGDKLSSQDQDSSTPSLKKRSSKAIPPVKNTVDVPQYQDDGVVPDTSTADTLSDTTSDPGTKMCDPSAIDISTGCKGVRRCATFPRTEGEVTVPKSVSSGQEPVMEPPIYDRSKSLPTHLKPALKGSRAQQPEASPRSVDLHVKWAPDVYDPPVTSQSHTVQSHSGRKGSGGGSSSKGTKKKKKKDKRKNKADM